MGLYTTPRRDYRFMSEYEKAHASALDLAQLAMCDAKSDESQALTERVVDEFADLRELLALAQAMRLARVERDWNDLGYRLALLTGRYADAEAEAVAEWECRTVTREVEA